MGLLLALFFVGNLDVQIISPILPLFEADFGVSTILAGMVVTSYAISGAIWALIIGPLSDRFGRIVFLRAAAVCFAIAAATAFFAAEFQFYIIARILAGLAGGTFSTCIIALIADIFPYEKRGRAMGLVGAIYSLAAVVGVPLGAIVASNYGWRPIYIFLGGTALLIALFLKRNIRIKPPESVRSADDQKMSESNRNGRLVQAVKGQILDYGRFWVNRKTRNGLLLAFAGSSTSTSLMTFLGKWLSADFGLTGGSLALVFLAAGVSTVIGSLLGGFLSDKIGKKQLILVASLLIVAIMSTTSFIGSYTGVVAFCIGGGLAIALREGPYQALITELVASRERGAYIAVRSTAAKLAIAGAAAFSGLLFELSGYAAVTAFSGACSLWAAYLVRFAIQPVAAAKDSTPVGDEIAVENNA